MNNAKEMCLDLIFHIAASAKSIEIEMEYWNEIVNTTLKYTNNNHPNEVDSYLITHDILKNKDLDEVNLSFETACASCEKLVEDIPGKCMPPFIADILSTYSNCKKEPVKYDELSLLSIIYFCHDLEEILYSICSSGGYNFNLVH